MEWHLHCASTMRILAGLTVTLAVTLAGCGDDARSTAKPDKAAAQTVVAETDPAAEQAEGVTGRHRDQPDWVPAEYKSGRGRWRDPGVYVDGKPMGFLWFGELPVGLEPVWVEEEGDVEFKPGDGKPRFEIVKLRRYRFADYFEHLGVELAKVKEVHIYGGKGKVMRVPGKLLRKHADDLHFGFGGGTFGKPIPYTPPGLRLNSYFDRITGISVYITKRPPTVVDGDGIKLGGEWVEGVPYFGEPLRGGVRVYKDDQLATVFKRRNLSDADELAEKSADGELRWNLFAVLEAKGVATEDIVEAAIIYDERRVDHLTREQLETLYFTASPQASGEILLGADRVPAQGLALHSEQIPQKVAAMHAALASDGTDGTVEE